MTTAPYWRKGDIDMTMQVVLRTGNNFVLASDTKHTEYEPGFDQIADRKQLAGFYNFSKVLFSTIHKHIAFAKSGDDALSSDIAEALSEFLDKSTEVSTDSKVFREVLTNLSTQVINNPRRSYNERAALTIINPRNDKTPIWKVRIEQPLRVVVQESAINVVSGHEHNTGIFWKEFLLNELKRPYPTTKELESIAAMMILFCSSLNPAGISGLEEFGLEIWTWQDDRWNHKSESELDELKNSYERLKRDILKHFRNT